MSEADLENRLYLDVPAGRVVIDLRPDKAPRHVERIKELVREGFYDGLTFHRVIPGFMAQGGCPRGDGSSGSGRRPHTAVTSYRRSGSSLSTIEFTTIAFWSSGNNQRPSMMVGLAILVSAGGANSMMLSLWLPSGRSRRVL